MIQTALQLALDECRTHRTLTKDIMAEIAFEHDVHVNDLEAEYWDNGTSPSGAEVLVKEAQELLQEAIEMMNDDGC